MLATLVAVRKDRDAKAELNRRSQACEVLTGTGISRRVRGDAHGKRSRHCRRLRRIHLLGAFSISF